MADITAVFPFLKLPLELRNMVYKEILVMPGVIEMWGWKLRAQVVQISRDESGRSMSEAISIYFASNKFYAEDSDMLSQFLYRIDPDACNAIREISIRYYSGKNAGKAFKLLAQCGSLCKFHLKLHTFYWMPDSWGGGLAEFFPLLKTPGIRSLLKVRGIQELDVDIAVQGYSPGYKDEEFDRDKESFIQALQVLKEPRDFQKQRRLPPKELWSKVPMMTRARASLK